MQHLNGLPDRNYDGTMGARRQSELHKGKNGAEMRRTKSGADLYYDSSETKMVAETKPLTWEDMVAQFGKPETAEAEQIMREGLEDENKRRAANKKAMDDAMKAGEAEMKRLGIKTPSEAANEDAAHKRAA